MDKLELVQTALRELGDVSAQELSSFIEQQHGVRIEPKFVPIFKASLRDKLRLEAARQAARVALEQGKMEGSGPEQSHSRSSVQVDSPSA